MNPEEILKEMELATWEIAEAETAERRAKQLRLSAAKRIAKFHAEFKAAVDAARRPKLTSQRMTNQILLTDH